MGVGVSVRVRVWVRASLRKATGQGEGEGEAHVAVDALEDEKLNGELGAVGLLKAVVLPSRELKRDRAPHLKNTKEKRVRMRVGGGRA